MFYVGEVRAFFSEFREVERCYVITKVLPEQDLVHIKWLDTGKQETYSFKSTELDRLLSPLERELL